jgi:tetratricopeptide (TPR) repeat protein
MSHDPHPERRLYGQEVAFTGRLVSLTREEAASQVVAWGGRFARFPGRKTSLLVVGQEGWPFSADGRLTRKLQKASELKRRGYPIDIVSEEEFLRRLGLAHLGEEVQRLYTVAQLGRLLGISRDRIRLWMRIGFIKPARTAHRLAYFDLRQVAGAKRLCELVRAGVAVERLRKSLLELRSWSPDAEEPLSLLPLLAREGRLLVRLESGQVAEPTGQLLIDFSTGGGDGGEALPATIVDLKPRTVDGWFELALRLEDSGKLGEARDAYREALAIGGPEPEICFNLANVLYGLGEKGRAVERYSQAIELDPEYVEAWNNLGNALGDLGQVEESLKAYRRALAVEPDYADAHFNLAEALLAIGREEEARAHWKTYLAQDPRSPWSEKARRRLGE